MDFLKLHKEQISDARSLIEVRYEILSKRNLNKFTAGNEFINKDHKLYRDSYFTFFHKYSVTCYLHQRKSKTFNLELYHKFVNYQSKFYIIEKKIIGNNGFLIFYIRNLNNDSLIKVKAAYVSYLVSYNSYQYIIDNRLTNLNNFNTKDIIKVLKKNNKRKASNQMKKNIKIFYTKQIIKNVKNSETLEVEKVETSKDISLKNFVSQEIAKPIMQDYSIKDYNDIHDYNLEFTTSVKNNIDKLFSVNTALYSFLNINFVSSDKLDKEKLSEFLLTLNNSESLIDFLKIIINLIPIKLKFDTFTKNMKTQITEQGSSVASEVSESIDLTF